MPAAQPPLSAKKRILIVDDKPSDTRLVKYYLEESGPYIVQEENDARLALAAAGVFQPHLILLDIRMPGMDGCELATHIRANPLLAGVPLVFLTALVAKSELAGNGGQSRMTPMLAKPIILKDLLACVRLQLGM